MTFFWTICRTEVTDPKCLGFPGHGFIHQQDRDAIPYGIDTAALTAREPFLLCVHREWLFADRADKIVGSKACHGANFTAVAGSGGRTRGENYYPVAGFRFPLSQNPSDVRNFFSEWSPAVV